MSSLYELNDRIFEAMDELDAAHGRYEQQQAIEKARAKAELFGLAIKNANTIVNAARMRESGMDGLATKIGATQALLGQPQILADVVQPPALPPVPSEALDWVRGNGAGHSVAWLCTKLGERFGRDFAADEVRELCHEADVVPVELGRVGIKKAESEYYAQKARDSDGRP